MTDVTANYSFQVMAEDDGYKYQYNQAKYGIKFGLAISFLPGLIAIFILSNYRFDSFQTALIIWSIMTAAGALLITFLLNKYARVTQEFFISNSKIIVRGKTYDRSHITSLEIRDPRGNSIGYNQHTSTGFIAGGRGITGAAAVGAAVGAQASKALAMELGKAISNVNYKLTFQYGEKVVVLAKGLSQLSARSLFDKILKNHGV
ncbi:MAG: hypothetical protein AAFN93_04135 [Bacteroidota bacterium]